jgi:23S rRNA pseudouridine2605 synthase
MNAQHRSVLSLKRGHTPQSPRLAERLHKVLANAGQGSRRMLETRIANGEIVVNGEVAELGASVSAGDRIVIDSHQFMVATDTRENAEVLIYNKPEGLLVTREDDQDRPTVFEQLPPVKGGRWIAVGRLDINTTGLLLVMTDGDLANALMHPSSGIEREYLCRVHGEVPPEALEKLQSGVDLDDGTARFDKIVTISERASHSWFRVTLGEGRNREVRRLWESQGCMVSRLKRIRYGNIELPRPLRRGQSEPLDAEHVRALRESAGLTAPQPALTLSPVVHQRRAHRNITEFTPDRRQHPGAWTGTRHDEARELTAFDRIREDKPARRGKHKHRAHGDVNGNVAQPDKAPSHKRKKKRNVAPGQELPSVRTWFAGDKRKGPGNRGKTGTRASGNGRGPRRGNKPHGSDH